MSTLDMPEARGSFSMPRGFTILGLALAGWIVVGGGAWTLLAIAPG